MAEQTENLVLDILRALRADMSAMREDFRDFKVRQNDMALSLAAVRRDQANDAGVSAHLQAQFDRLKEEVELIKRRPDIAPAK